MRAQRFFLLVVVAVSASWFLARVEYERASLTGQLTAEAAQSLRRQKVGSRSWWPPPDERVLTLESSDETILYGPLRLHVDADGSLFVLDYGASQVKEFTPDGRFVRASGAGVGQGPGEIATPTDFTVTAAGEVVVADPTNGRLTVFGESGELARTLKLERPGYRLSPAPDGGFFILFELAEMTFGRVDSTGKLVDAFGVLLDDQLRKGLLLEGFLTETPNQGFIYAAHYAGLLAAYDREGRNLWVVETLDRQPLPRLLQDADSMWVDREAHRSALSVSVSRRGVHVFSYVEGGLDPRPVVDTYRLADGTYEGSWEVPERGRAVVVTDEALFVVKPTSISQWRLATRDS
jgi:hypothetical protein